MQQQKKKPPWGGRILAVAELRRPSVLSMLVLRVECVGGGRGSVCALLVRGMPQKQKKRRSASDPGLKAEAQTQTQGSELDKQARRLKSISVAITCFKI